MKLDTAGKSLGQAKLVQADIVTVSDSIEFNFKTQKGLTHSSYFSRMSCSLRGGGKSGCQNHLCLQRAFYYLQPGYAPFCFQGKK